MKSTEIARQLMDPTGDVAVAQADRFRGPQWREIRPLRSPEILAKKPESLVEPVNGVRTGHQTGTTAIGSIEVQLAEIRRKYKDPNNMTSYADLSFQKKALLANLKALRRQKP